MRACEDIQIFNFLGSRYRSKSVSFESFHARRPQKYWSQKWKLKSKTDHRVHKSSAQDSVLIETNFEDANVCWYHSNKAIGVMFSYWFIS